MTTTKVTLTGEQRDLLEALLGQALDQHHDAEQENWDYLAESFETTEQELLDLLEVLGAPPQSVRFVWGVNDLQACAREELPESNGIEIVDQRIDNQGFQRVMVAGPTREAVLEYVREHWGDEDHDWFESIEDSIFRGEV